MNVANPSGALALLVGDRKGIQPVTSRTNKNSPNPGDAA